MYSNGSQRKFIYQVPDCVCDEISECKFTDDCYAKVRETLKTEGIVDYMEMSARFRKTPQAKTLTIIIRIYDFDTRVLKPDSYVRNDSDGVEQIRTGLAINGISICNYENFISPNTPVKGEDYSLSMKFPVRKVIEYGDRVWGGIIKQCRVDDPYTPGLLQIRNDEAGIEIQANTEFSGNTFKDEIKMGFGTIQAVGESSTPLMVGRETGKGYPEWCAYLGEENAFLTPTKFQEVVTHKKTATFESSVDVKGMSNFRNKVNFLFGNNYTEFYDDPTYNVMYQKSNDNSGLAYLITYNDDHVSEKRNTALKSNTGDLFFNVSNGAGSNVERVRINKDLVTIKTGMKVEGEITATGELQSLGELRIDGGTIQPSANWGLSLGTSSTAFNYGYVNRLNLSTGLYGKGTISGDVDKAVYSGYSHTWRTTNNGINVPSSYCTYAQFGSGVGTGWDFQLASYYGNAQKFWMRSQYDGSDTYNLPWERLLTDKYLESYYTDPKFYSKTNTNQGLRIHSTSSSGSHYAGVFMYKAGAVKAGLYTYGTQLNYNNYAGGYHNFLQDVKVSGYMMADVLYITSCKKVSQAPAGVSLKPAYVGSDGQIYEAN